MYTLSQQSNHFKAPISYKKNALTKMKDLKISSAIDTWVENMVIYKIWTILGKEQSSKTKPRLEPS